MELHFLTVAEASQLIRERKLSPVELTQAFLGRIASLDNQINAFITTTADRAIKQARRAEAEIVAGRYRGPMHGVPFGLKDVIDTAGILTSADSKVAIDNVPTRDATATAKLYEAGAILIGKLATHEFAFGGCFDLPWPPARNPWNREHFTGGSSSGPAAAVASGFIPAALGTDTGGSIRTPSSLCGVVGLKPTYGLVSRAGVITNSFTFDHVGPMAWTVEDCALILQAIAGHDPGDPSSTDRPIPNYSAALTPDIRGLRVGVLRHFWEEDLPAAQEVRQAMDAAIEVLSRLGAKVGDARMRPIHDYYDVKMVIAETELFAIHQKNLMRRLHDFGPEFLTRSLPACLFDSVDYVQAQRKRRQMLVEMKRLYENYDVFVTASPGPAPRLDEFRNGAQGGFVPGVIGAGIDFWKRPSMTTPFNMMGGPALALCNGFTQSGMPLSMQIVGRPFDDASVLKVAYAYEQATAWRSLRPTLTPETPPQPLPAAVKPLGPPLIDASTRPLVESKVRRAGLKLTEMQFAQLCLSAPYAVAMADRVRHEIDWADEPANVFQFA